METLKFSLSRLPAPPYEACFPRGRTEPLCLVPGCHLIRVTGIGYLFSGESSSRGVILEERRHEAWGGVSTLFNCFYYKIKEWKYT